MSVHISPNLPANVVEIGNEISQAKIDEINSGTLANQIWVNSHFLSLLGGTITGGLLVDETGTSGWSTSYNGVGVFFNETGAYISQEENLITGFNIQIPVEGILTFGDGSTQTTASTGSDPKKNIANLCASCFTSNGSTFQFTNYVAMCVAQGSKFTSGSPYRLGLGYIGSTPTYSFTLTYSSPSVADTGVMFTSAGGSAICYSEDGGSTWTYSDLSF
jgi:hypothetical protein